MPRIDLEHAAKVAEAAADRARREILPRFRRVATERKRDGSPVTEADRAAEQAMRALLREATPELGVMGEEFGAEGDMRESCWLLDPIDGTIGFSRGIPLFSTLITLVEEGEPALALIDLPALDERFVGWRGGGTRRNGVPVHVSRCADPKQALVAHGDVFCFDWAGQRGAFERLAREIPLLRGYTDAFGHAQVVQGSVDAMVDLMLSPWDIGPVRVLIPEAGGRCETFALPDDKLGTVFGSPALVEILLGYLEGVG